MGIKEHISQGDGEYCITGVKQILSNVFYITNVEFMLYKLLLKMKLFYWTGTDKALVKI